MKAYRYLVTIVSIFLFFIWTSVGLSGQTKTIFEHLTSSETPKILLEADITNIIAGKKTNQYFPGTLTTEDGTIYKVELKPRGRYRRKVAEIPPLKIKFKKKDITASGLDTFNEIKLVLPCYDTDLGDQLLVKEYLAYKMFESITGASTKARLIKLSIRDLHVEKSKKAMYAILLEDEEEMTHRLKGTLVEEYGISPDSLIMNQAALVALFEYMIGNTDWDVSMMRNVRLIKSTENGKVLVVPYDFDFSGLVGAPYASPSSESGLKTVKDRFLMANGIKEDALKKALQVLKSSRKQLKEICQSKYLNRQTSEDMIAYLDSFFIGLEGKDIIPQMLKMPQTD